MSSVVAAIVNVVISPVVNYWIDKRKNTKQSRRETIKRWREELANLSNNEILGSSVYPEIEPYLSEQTKKCQMGRQRCVQIDAISGVIAPKTHILKDIAKLEKKWGLLD